MTEPAVQGEQQSISANAPAWTPGGLVTDVPLLVASPCDDKAKDTGTASETAAAAPETKGGGEIGGSSSVAASETAAQAKEGGEVGDSSSVTIEPKVPADKLNP